MRNHSCGVASGHSNRLESASAGMIDSSGMDKGKVQEALTTLYLRLNGYFTTGLIVHSAAAHGNNTEIDVLAVRLPKHEQQEREVGLSGELDCSAELLDIVIGEVKSFGQKLQFNEGVRSIESVTKILSWVGAFERGEIPDLAEKLRKLLEPKPIANSTALVVLGPRNTRIRALLFSPERNGHRGNQPWFLAGPPILEYLWLCLNPGGPRSECATKYDFGLWGSDLEPLVRHIKASPLPPTFKVFYEGLERTNGTAR